MLIRHAELEGNIIVPKEFLTEDDIAKIRKDLNIAQVLFAGALGMAAKKICILREDENYLYVPRYYPVGNYSGFEIDKATLTDGRVAPPIGRELEAKFKLIPERGQVDAADAMEKQLRRRGSGILIAFTGMGKTLLGYEVGRRLKTPIGVFVYNAHMMDNWASSAKKFFGLEDEDIGRVVEERCDLGRPVTIMMVQSLYSSREYPKELYRQLGYICCDEINRFGSEIWSTVIGQFPAKYRMGMSADPDRKDGLTRIIELNFGDVGFEASEEQKAKPTIIMVKYGWKLKSKDITFTYGKKRGHLDVSKYKRLVAKDERRNRMIVGFMGDARKKSRRALVFSDYRQHVLTLTDMLLDSYQARGIEGTATPFLGGSKDVEGDTSGDFVLTTYALSRDGLNLPKIDTEFFTLPTSNPLQPLGRLRDIGDAGRQSLVAMDFYEDNPLVIEYAEKRFDFYQERGCEVIFKTVAR